MNEQKVLQVSVGMQALADSIERYLTHLAGERCAFVLVAATGYVIQHVTNASRPDARVMLEGTLENLPTEQGSLPAHANPAVQGLVERKEADELLTWALDIVSNHISQEISDGAVGMSDDLHKRERLRAFVKQCEASWG